MPNPNRLLALLLLVTFGISLFNALNRSFDDPRTSVTASLLPAAIAAPLDVGYQDTLRAGETLSELLARADLAGTEAQALIDALQPHQDPRRMRPGAVFAFRRSIENGSLRRVELQLDSDRTLNVMRDGDAWAGEVAQVPVQVDTVLMTGVIESSLYGALLEGENDAIPMDERERLVDILADRIFAWQIDFSRDLRSGDEFRILYERLVRPDGSARTGHVLSAQFTVNEREYEAYAFAPGDGSEDYFDAEGESLRRAFLRAPLKYRRISSVYTSGRFHPILKVSRPHRGIDYAASSGTPVYAVGDGTVRRASRGGDYGNVVDISHTRGYSTRYGHLRSFADGIRSGVRVKQGDLIGYVGQTGLATGPHLHYEFHSGGRAIDPNTIRDITGDPVPGQYLEQFLGAMRAQITSLDALSRGTRFANWSRPTGRPIGD